MSEKKYYYVKYRECRYDEEGWEHYSFRTDIHPFMNKDCNSEFLYSRVIDFYTEITEEEYNMKVQ